MILKHDTLEPPQENSYGWNWSSNYQVATPRLPMISNKG